MSAMVAAAVMLGRVVARWFHERPFAVPLSRQRRLRRKLRVAVVGAGVGGSALSCWLRDLYGDDLELTVVSDGPVGGRCQSVGAADGKTYEGGASIVSDLNEYFLGFMRRFGFKQKYFKSLDVPLGLYDKEVFFREADPTQAPLGLTRLASLRSAWRFLQRYGFFGLKRLKDLMKHKFTPDFSKLYKALEEGDSFQNLDALLSVLGPRCRKLTQETATEWLTKPSPDGPNVPHDVVRELATAGMRCNYGGQSCDDLHGFVGAVSCAGGMSSRCLAVAGGNQQVPKKLVEVARPESLLLGWTARAVERSKTGTIDGRWNLLVEKTGEAEACAEAMKGAGSPPQRDARFLEERGPFDIVALAHPLARSCLRMEDALAEKARHSLEFQRCVAHFVWGVLRSSHFTSLGSADKAPPMAVLTVAGSTAPFYSIGLNLPVDITEKDAHKQLQAALSSELAVFKVFAPEVLSRSQLEDIFERIEGEVKVLDWYAYPKYSLLQNLAPLALDDEEEPSLLYLNAIEEVASAMEMSAIAARNAANLVVRFVDRRREGQPLDSGF